MPGEQAVNGNINQGLQSPRQEVRRALQALIQAEGDTSWTLTELQANTRVYHELPDSPSPSKAQTSQP